MDYNTQRNRLVIPEYGRNIQRMIEEAVKIQDREERNRAARTIVSVMGYLNPQLQTVTDFKHKLWDHLFIISDFKLDVDSPYPVPEKEKLKAKPKRVNYPNWKIKYKYYGHAMEDLIRKVSEMEDGPKKQSIAHNIANFMKLSYLTWNKDTVDDATIFNHLEEISGGKLRLTDVRLNHTSELLAMNKKPDQDRRQQHMKKQMGKKKKGRR